MKICVAVTSQEHFQLESFKIRPHKTAVYFNLYPLLLIWDLRAKPCLVIHIPLHNSDMNMGMLGQEPDIQKRGATLTNVNWELKFVIFHRSFASNKPLTVHFPNWVKCIIRKKVPPYLPVLSPINTRACSAISSCLCSTLPNWMLTTKGGGWFLFVFKPYQQASTSKYWTSRGSIKECTDYKWPGIRAGCSSSVGTITKSSSNCLWNCILSAQLKYLNSYSPPSPLYPQPFLSKFFPLCQYEHLCNHRINYTRELIQWGIKLAETTG